MKLVVSNLLIGLTLVLVLSACGGETTDAPTTEPVPTFDPSTDLTPSPAPLTLKQGINLFTQNCTNPAVASTCVVASKEITVEVFIDDGNGGGAWYLLTFSGPVKTDATGRLKIGLEAGHYRIAPKDIVAGGPASQEVDIVADTFLNATLKWDI